MCLGIGAFPFIMGVISGYPTGAKIVSNFKENNLCTEAECERLLAFTNNSGPLFIIGTVGISLFGSPRIGFLLFITHFISCIIVGFLFRFWKFNAPTSTVSSKNNFKTSKVSFSNLGELLATSITNSINTLFMIGGFVVLFSVILSILENSNILKYLTTLFTPISNLLNISPNFIEAIFSGILELTNGLSKLSTIATKQLSTNIVISAFLLGFGGFSVVLQVLSIVSKSNISIKPYLIGKFLQGLIASFLTFIVINNFTFFNFDIVNIFSNNVNNVFYSNSNFGLIILSITAIFALITISFKHFHKKEKGGFYG